MKLYIVFVTFKQTGTSGSFRMVRYIDSQWANEEHAKARKEELGDSLTMFNVQDWVVTIKTGQIADASVTDDRKAANAG